jgi:sugar/nucleoside kinase (ribokinase family)
MRITFLGHVSKDVNVLGGAAHLDSGGGVYYGAVAARRLGADVMTYTKCAPGDRTLFAALGDAGVEVVYLPSATSTSIENTYHGDRPDARTSRLLSRGEPFHRADLAVVEAEVLHINPLWRGEFPPALLPVARERARVLSADAQGFLRVVQSDGRMWHGDWEDKRAFLPYLDLLKVDAAEGLVLTGCAEPRAAAERLHALGPRRVLVTHEAGVCAFDGRSACEAPWAGFTLEGRTGRGDTCSASFLVALGGGASLHEATASAARVTSEKMRYRGPYRG